MIRGNRMPSAPRAASALRESSLTAGDKSSGDGHQIGERKVKDIMRVRGSGLEAAIHLCADLGAEKAEVFAESSVAVVVTKGPTSVPS